MIKKMIILFCGVFSLSAFVGIRPMMIYGQDNRQEIYQIHDQSIRDLADSVAAIIPGGIVEVKSNSEQNIKLNYSKYITKKHLCSDERFAEQIAPANCTAFLVGPDLLATAGHCVDENNCSDFSYVFGFREHENLDENNYIHQKDIYHCKKIVAREMTAIQDYAVIQLDRVVEDHKILKIANSHNLQVGDSVFVVGYPSGLPEKIADNAHVRSIQNEYFVTNLDTFGSNSGSPVFSEKTHEVLGILVRGDKDFVLDEARDCMKSYRCLDDECRGEDSTQISYIQQVLFNLNQTK